MSYLIAGLFLILVINTSCALEGAQSGFKSKSTTKNETIDCEGDQDDQDDLNEYLCEVENVIFIKTNELRESEGVEALSYDSKIAFVSRDWSRVQAEKNKIGHEGFPNKRNEVYKNKFPDSKLPFLNGENVAQSYSKTDAKETGEMFFNMWVTSPGHKKNMIGKRTKRLGVGVYFSKNDKKSRKIYATQLFSSTPVETKLKK